VRKGIQYGGSGCCIWQPLDVYGRYDPDQLEPYFALPEFDSMADAETPLHYFDLIKKSVLFIGTKEKGTFRPRATAFVVTIRDQDLGFRYLVTADHVISKLLATNKEIWLRSNRKDGSSQEDNWSGAEWMFHPDVGSTDIAIASINFNADEDFRALLLSGDKSLAATQELLLRTNVNVGHEVFIAGLFRSHYGRQRNIPIIRTGEVVPVSGTVWRLG